VEPGDWLAGQSLGDLRLSYEGVLVLGIERPDGVYLGAPRGDSQLLPRDRILLYGRQEVLDDLDRRGAGVKGDAAPPEGRRRAEVPGGRAAGRRGETGSVHRG
jgi:uncharacterized protein with PhoU and TrkA domain